MTDILKKHPALLYANDIKDICRPLNKLNISYFAYVHVDKTNSFSALANNPEYTEYYLRNRYYNADIHMAQQDAIPNYFVWDSIEGKGVTAEMGEAANYFGVKHNFTIIEKNHQGYHYYHFGTGEDDFSINQIYLTHLDLLQKFNLYFHEKINESKKLNLTKNMKFILDEKQGGFLYEDRLLEKEQHSVRQSFLQDLRLNSGLLRKAELSSRQMEILIWLHRGKTIHDIARITGIADVTVNKHIAEMKQKLQCYTQFQLGEYFASLFNV